MQISNYEKNCEQWRERFLSMDQQRLMTLLPELKPEGDYLTLSHFGERYGVHRQTGRILRMSDRRSASVTARLNIYTLFGYVSPQAHFIGDWVVFESLRGTAPFAAAFRRGILEPLARTFTGHMDRLEAALQAMGGRKLTHGDVGYEVDAFACIPVRYLFWEGDEEFPAQANMLFDRSATDFIHEESIVSIAMVGLSRLAELAQLPVDRAAFPMM